MTYCKCRGNQSGVCPQRLRANNDMSHCNRKPGIEIPILRSKQPAVTISSHPFTHLVYSNASRAGSPHDSLPGCWHDPCVRVDRHNATPGTSARPSAALFAVAPASTFSTCCFYQLPPPLGLRTQAHDLVDVRLVVKSSHLCWRHGVTRFMNASGHHLSHPVLCTVKNWPMTVVCTITSLPESSLTLLLPLLEPLEFCLVLHILAFSKAGEHELEMKLQTIYLLRRKALSEGNGLGRTSDCADTHTNFLLFVYLINR